MLIQTQYYIPRPTGERERERERKREREREISSFYVICKKVFHILDASEVNAHFLNQYSKIIYDYSLIVQYQNNVIATNDFCMHLSSGLTSDPLTLPVKMMTQKQNK